MARRTARPTEGDKFVEQVMYCLTAPMVGWPGWEDLLRQHKAEISLRRLALVQQVYKEQMATEYEAMLYLSTASLAHPMPRDWAEVYQHLFYRWNREKAEELGLDNPKLNPNQVEDLNRLRQWLFRRQVEHLRGKLREGPVPEPPKEPAAEVQQLAFDF